MALFGAQTQSNTCPAPIFRAATLQEFSDWFATHDRQERVWFAGQGIGCKLQLEIRKELTLELSPWQLHAQEWLESGVKLFELLIPACFRWTAMTWSESVQTQQEYED